MRLFSAYAEVFPSAAGLWLLWGAFLCLRRGVSDGRFSGYFCGYFSLPTQRCFQADDLLKSELELFSAYAEVFLKKPSGVRFSRAFLCLRRGVSLTEVVGKKSPALFSAYAEVFLR